MAIKREHRSTAIAFGLHWSPPRPDSRLLPDTHPVLHGWDCLLGAIM
ncbi:hypothetical protein [Actinokineospora sp. NBRC 105648]|nr:hypothetical protein [Actinokineospora sp. NBRC 105648]